MKFIYFIATLLLLTACDPSGKAPSKQFWMDNPTDKTIQVKIDSVVYDLPANSGLTVELLAGRHSLAYDGESVQFFVKPNDQGCVINPTLSNYIFFHEIYIVEGKEKEGNAEYEKMRAIYMHPFEIQPGDTIDVPFQVISDQLFIEQYEYFWHLGITESYKNNAKTSADLSRASTAPLSKLFRENDFYSYVGRENLPEGFALKQSSYKLSDLKPFVFVADTITVDCEPAQKYLDLYRSRFKELLSSDAAHYQAKYDTLRYYTKFPTEVEKECSSRYNKGRVSSDNDIDKASVRIGKNLEKLGEKNAFIIN